MGGQTKGDYAVIQSANLKDRNKEKADARLSMGFSSTVHGLSSAWLSTPDS
jgi:hypothetical protein